MTAPAATGGPSPRPAGDAARPPGPDVRLAAPAAAAWLAAWWATGAATVAVAAAAVGALLLGAVALVVALAPAPLAAAPLARAARAVPPAGPAPAVPVARAAASVALTLAAAAAVLGSAAAGLGARTAGPWPGWVEARAVAALDATVASDPTALPDRQRPGGGTGGGTGGAAPRPDRWVLRVDVATATARGATARVGLPVLVLAGRGWQHVSAGQRVRLSARLAAPRPGDEVAAVVTALGPPAAVHEGTWPWRVADAVRASLRRACEGLPADAGGLLPSLVDGDTTVLPQALREDLKAAGMSHLTAVSGANLAIMSASALWVANALRLPRAVRLPLLVLTLLGFVVLARPSASVLRAAGMGAVAIAAAGASRRPRGVPALAAAVVVLLAGDPWLARGPGFVLSALATGALLLLAPPWADALARHVPRPLALALAAPAAAQVVCAPVVVLLQPAVSVVAVPANLVAEPAVAPATVAGVVAALTGVVTPPLAHVVAMGGALGTGWIAVVAHTSARLPLASVPWPAGPPGALLLAVLEAVAVTTTLPRWRRALRRRLPVWLAGEPGRGQAPVAAPTAPARRGAPRRRVVAFLLLGVPAVTAAGTGLRLLRGAPGRFPADWAVAMCDVGQGDATVLRSGPDRAVLVDAGPDPALVGACLGRLGVRHLDLVVLTHFHEDHVGGLTGALDGRDAHGLLVSPLARPTPNAAAVERQASALGLPVSVAREGQSGRSAAGAWAVEWRVVAAAAGAVAGDDDGTGINESSVALDVTVRGPGGPVHVVLLGDLETQGQQALAARLASGAEQLAGAVDLVKVAHHGSSKQSPDLYRLLRARLGLIGVGAGNDYGHPAPGALAMLRSTGTAVLRTDLAGDVCVAVSGGGALTVRTRR